MEMVMHNVKGGVTVAARYEPKNHAMLFSISLCKRSVDSFSRKQGFKTATLRLDRRPTRIYLASDKRHAEDVKQVMFAIKDATRVLTRRRTGDSVAKSIQFAIRGCSYDNVTANEQLACTDEPCGTGF